MDLPEYYLTRSEYEILNFNAPALLENFRHNGNTFDLIEFGSGDGMKTKLVLDHFINARANFKYFPIDISQNALDSLSRDLEKNLPDLDFESIQGEYFSALERVYEIDSNNKIIFFLGSNIGNFTNENAHTFLNHLSNILQKGDKVMIGFDLKKDPSIIKSI